jgi:hypothetical protein
MKIRLERVKTRELQEFLEAESKTKMVTCVGERAPMRTISVNTNVTKYVTKAANRVITAQIFSYFIPTILCLSSCFYLPELTFSLFLIS